MKLKKLSIVIGTLLFAAAPATQALEESQLKDIRAGSAPSKAS